MVENTERKSTGPTLHILLLKKSIYHKVSLPERAGTKRSSPMNLHEKEKEKLWKMALRVGPFVYPTLILWLFACGLWELPAHSTD